MGLQPAKGHPYACLTAVVAAAAASTTTSTSGQPHPLKSSSPMIRLKAQRKLHFPF